MKKRSRKKTNNPKVSLAVDDEVDRISELPDDILKFIISLLNFREATAIKILSSRWSRLDPTRTPNVVTLDFPVPEECWYKDTIFYDYISQTNQALDSYEGGQSIDRFKIDIPCDKGSHWEKWLEFALSKEAEIIDIRMIHRNKNKPGDCYLYSSLDHEILRFQNDLRGFKYLKELALSSVHVADYGKLLSKFIVLERLSIDTPQTGCNDIRLCGIHSGSVSKLKYLNISNFARFCDIRVCDMMKLVSLKCHGPELCYLHLDNVPKLVYLSTINARPHIYGGILPRKEFDVVYPRLLHFNLYIRLLELGTATLRNYMPPRFERLKQMVLEIEIDTECSNHRLFPLIQTCPSMEELEIKFVWSSKVAIYKHIDCNKDLIRRKAAIYKLKTVRLSGYLGSKSELEFVLYVVNNAKKLKKLIIVEAPKKSYAIRKKCITPAIEHLRCVIPSSVNFISL